MKREKKSLEHFFFQEEQNLVLCINNVLSQFHRVSQEYGFHCIRCLLLVDHFKHIGYFILQELGIASLRHSATRLFHRYYEPISSVSLAYFIGITSLFHWYREASS